MWHHKPHTTLLATRGCLSYTKAKIMQVRAQWSLLRLPSRSLSYTKIMQVRVQWSLLRLPSRSLSYTKLLIKACMAIADGSIYLLIAITQGGM